MANATYGAHTGGEDSRGPAQYANIVGAAISLAVFIGISGWAVKTMLRDASGVPTVRAMEGPMTVRPDDPGGVEAAHLGLSVNRVSGTSEVAETPAVQLAPQPDVLAEEDVAGALLAADRPEARPAVFANETQDQLVQAAVADALQATDLEATSGVAQVGVPVAHLRPRGRPQGLVRASVAASAPQAAPAAAPAQVVEAAAQTPVNTVPAGTRLAQLGAYESRALAEREWLRISGKNANFFTGKTHVVQEASKNGKLFYRLRVVGFSDASDARRFCSALISKNLACYPVVMR